MSLIYTGDTQHISNVYNNLLFLGSSFATRYDTIVKRNIKHIISIGCLPQKIPGCTYYHFEVDDANDEKSVCTLFEVIMPQIHTIINDCINKGEPILVHCQAGMSRSASIVIMWCILYHRLTYNAAFDHVKKCRSVISPNKGFIQYMSNYSI